MFFRQAFAVAAKPVLPANARACTLAGYARYLPVHAFLGG